MDETTEYYQRRADEYDRIYSLAHWQADLAVLHAVVEELATGRRVLEAACGTGYWTERLARTAAHVCGVDVNSATLAVARTRAYAPGAVTFVQADLYRPLPLAPRFDAAFAGLWLSHVDMTRMGGFLDAFHAPLAPGARVMLFDERQTDTRAAATARTDLSGNRYEKRKLTNGSRFEILKNWYDAGTLRELFRERGEGWWYRELDRFWLCGYTTPMR